jgi:hypothetical protein
MSSDRRASAFHRLGHWLLLGASLLAFDCESAREEPTGGETHFLQSCEADPGVCGPELSCLCSVCTLACNEQAACASLPGASCVLDGNLGACELPSAGRCDVACLVDADCSELSRSHRCAAGVCRVPPADDSSCEPSGLDPNQVLIIGDSFFAASHRITAFLEDLARQSGALMTGERYRDNARMIGNALALGGNGIEEQYAAASAESAVGVVIMNGGGADVLLGSCPEVTPDCPLLTDAAAAASALFSRMADEGVEHVIFAAYPDPLDAAVREEMDALRPLLESACAASPVPCHWVDLRPSFAGNYAAYVEADGLNPTPDGARATAGAIWSTMRQQCIAQ